MSLFALVHSPSVGPATWQPVAERLRESGHEAVVPSLLSVAAGRAPYWPRVVTAVRAGLAGKDPVSPLILAAHSNAGVFVPVLARDLGRPVACAIFADATVPAADGATSVAGDDFLPFLRGLADEDWMLPRWTDWWADSDIATVLPDPLIRRVITDEQPRLPLQYFVQRVPTPAGWDRVRCCFLQFSAAYDGEAAEARRRGWPVRHVPGEHLHQVVDPDAVTRALIELATSP